MSSIVTCCHTNDGLAESKLVHICCVNEVSACIYKLVQQGMRQRFIALAWARALTLCMSANLMHVSPDIEYICASKPRVKVAIGWKNLMSHKREGVIWQTHPSPAPIPAFIGTSLKLVSPDRMSWLRNIVLRLSTHTGRRGNDKVAL